MAEPTDRELYEQVKRPLRHLVLDGGLVKEGQPAFVLACSYCGLPFRDDIEVGMMGDHMRTHGVDPNNQTDEKKMKLDLIWIGEGPPPKAGNSNA